MEVKRGDFAFDFVSGAVKGSANKEYLDPEIASEGTKVILSNGTEVRWSPPPAKPIIPDWSEIKSIRHYFNRNDHQFFPCWLYHPTQEPVIAKSAQEAGEKYGVELLERTDAERAEYGGGKYRWKFRGQWRTMPYHLVKSSIEASGKNLEIKKPDPIIELTRALQNARGDAHSSAVDPAMIEEFRQFQAWKTKLRNAEIPQENRPSEELSAASVLNSEPTTPIENGDGDSKELWIAKAAEADIKIDKTWSAETMRRYIIQELERRVAERTTLQRDVATEMN